MAISLDTSRFPIVITTVAGALTSEELEPYLADFLNLAVRRGGIFVSLVDARQLNAMPSAVVRSRLASWQAEHALEGEQRNKGIAIITDSAVVRGAMTAVNWLHRPRVATTYVATMAAAEAWARQRLET